MTGYMKCFTCKSYTTTSNLYIHEQEDKTGPCFYLKGICNKCRKNKNTRLGKKLKPGITKNSTSDELLKLLPNSPKNGGAILTVSNESTESTESNDNTESTDTNVTNNNTASNAQPNNSLDSVIVATAATTDDVDGEGFWDSIKNIGRKKTFADKIGDTAAKFTKSAVRSIPIVGDLIADSGIVDAGIDWISDNVWQPIKNHFGWALDIPVDELKENLKNNDTAIQDILEKLLEVKIKTGDGIVPNYIGELRKGTTEDKALAHVLMKTLCKPKFYKYLKDENVPSSMSIIEAFTKYKSKPKTYKNQEDKAQQILTSLGYSFT